MPTGTLPKISRSVPQNTLIFLFGLNTVFLRGVEIATHLNMSLPWYKLGPNKHGLVTYVQVNVNIGNKLSWLDGG